VIGSYAYYRPYGATKFTTEDTSSLPMNPALPSGPAYVVSQILAVAADPGLSPVLVGIEQEQYGTCYHIRVGVTQSALNAKLQSSFAVQSLGSGQVDLWITEGSFELERLEFSTSDPNSGAAAVRLVLSNWNNVSPILTPPDSELDIQANPT